MHTELRVSTLVLFIDTVKGRNRKRSRAPQKKTLEKQEKMMEVKRRRLEATSSTSTAQAASGSSTVKSSVPSEEDPCTQSGNKSNLSA